MVQRSRLLDSLALLLFLIICIGGVAFWGSPAHALFSPNKDKKEKNVTGNNIQIRENTRSVSPEELQKDASWKSFLSKYGGGWKVLQNQTANYLRVDSTDLSRKPLRKLSNQTDFAEEAKKFVRENESIFKVSYQNLRLEKVYQRAGMCYVRFTQYFSLPQGLPALQGIPVPQGTSGPAPAADIPVYGSSLTFRYQQQSGNLLTFSGNIYAGITLDPQSSQVSPVAVGAPLAQGAPVAQGVLVAVDSQAAIHIAADNLGLSPDSLTCNESRLVIYPYREQGNQQFTYRLCWEIEITSIRKGKGWRYFIDARDRTIIGSYDRARYSIAGKIQGQIYPEYPNMTIAAPFPNLKINVLDKTTPLMYNNLDSNPSWSGTSMFGWEYGFPVPDAANGTGADPGSGHSGTNVYGYNLQGSYPSNLSNTEYLTTAQIERIGGGRKETILRFWRWLGVDGSDSDSANIQINDYPGTWREIWSNPKESIYDGDWKLVYYDLSSFLSDSKNALLIRWGLGPTNNSYNYCGWNLDDIGVYNAVQGVSNENGNFTVSNEADNNILDINLNGVYFDVKTTLGEGLVYTNGSINRNNTNVNITLKPNSDYSSQTDSGVISASADMDELNAYYHANHLIEHIQALDPNFPAKGTGFFPISITVHDTEEPTNSYWLEGEGIYFGEGNKYEYQDFAQYSDIIYHEVTHAIIDSIYEDKAQPQTNSTRFTMFDAIHEAFSDYWACTMNNDSQIAEGGFWTGGVLRDLENTLNYQDNYGSELYESSLVLSGAMWDLREALRTKYKGDPGVKVADTLFLFATYSEPTTYLDFFDDVLLVDETRYGKANERQIRDAFGSKGIADPPARPESIQASVDHSTVRLSWGPVDGATGYNLYYGVSSIRALQSSSRYNTGGTPGIPGNGGDGGSMDTGGSMDGNGGTPGGNNGSGSNNNITRNLQNKVDVGDVTSYNIDNLQSNTTYLILITAYNDYGIESSPSQDIYATPVDPNSAKQDYILVPGSSQSSSKKTCFITSIGSWLGAR
jgi:hypothetical protein